MTTLKTTLKTTLSSGNESSRKQGQLKLLASDGKGFSKRFSKLAASWSMGTNCPYEEIFPKLRKNCCDHTWLVPLVVLSYSLIFLKEQVKIPHGLYL